jgi:catechol 2,3-dioxygenase-like lactoylglutathione lyase family enzyme
VHEHSELEVIPVTKFYARAVFFVRDASRSLAFYTTKLGFSLDWTYEDNGKPHVFQVSLHGFELILNQAEPATIDRPGHGRVFIGLDEDGSVALKLHIESRSITITHVHWGAPTIAIYDPDQNEMLFWLADSPRDMVQRGADVA